MNMDWCYGSVYNRNKHDKIIIDRNFILYDRFCDKNKQKRFMYTSTPRRKLYKIILNYITSPLAWAQALEAENSPN